ncbi:DNA cytosine methyltransferase [soil metagenome]
MLSELKGDNSNEINFEIPRSSSASTASFDRLFLRSKKAGSTFNSGRKVICADLFSGCGGLSLGVKTACTKLDINFQSALAIDNEINSLETYVKNFSPRQAFSGGIEGIISGNFGDPTATFERDLINGVKVFDFLVAGPPCQGHSNLNNHTRRNDTRNRLYDKVGRFAEIARPTNILIENVPAIIHCNDGSFHHTYELLNRLGYSCDDGIINLLDVGVPQKRKRHVLVASLEKKIIEGSFVKSVIEKYRSDTERTVRWAIEDLERRNGLSIFESSSTLSTDNMSRIHYLFENDMYDLPNSHRPICHQNDVHTYGAMYGRLDYDAPAQTITTGFGSPGQGRYIHPKQPRTLTPHEAARLQFFPDSFDFSNVKHRGHLARMIGNAVPMKLAYIFGLELLS